MKTKNHPFGIASTTFLSVRSNPDHRSELLTQILFGETFAILDDWDDWIHVEILPHKQRGWIPNHSFLGLPTPSPDSSDENDYINLQQVMVKQFNSDRYAFPVLPGSSLSCKPEMGKSFKIGGQSYLFDSPVPEDPAIGTSPNLEALSLIFINTPYLWGGRSVYGIDNSHLIQLVFKMSGVDLPGSYEELLKQGEPVPFAHDAQAGDLAFFENKEGEIVHAGIITQPGKIIHCMGQVREDPIDHAGIYGVAEERYLFYLRLINRIL